MQVVCRNFSMISFIEFAPRIHVEYKRTLSWLKLRQDVVALQRSVLSEERYEEEERGTLAKRKVALLETGGPSRFAVQTTVFSGIPAIKIPTAYPLSCL
jgi:hypothetical protein